MRKRVKLLFWDCKKKNCVIAPEVPTTMSVNHNTHFVLCKKSKSMVVSFIHHDLVGVLYNRFPMKDSDTFKLTMQFLK